MPPVSQVRPWILGPLGGPDPALPFLPSQRVDEDAAPEAITTDCLALAEQAEARAEGFRAGYDEGLRAASEQERASVRALAGLAERAAQDAEDFLRTVEREVVQLSLAIAAKVVEREVRVDPGVVLDVVRSALGEIREATVIRVRLNPADHDLVAAHWRDVGPNLFPAGDVLAADERVARGGCVIEMGVGRVDAQTTSKLDRLSDTFRALLEGEPA